MTSRVARQTAGLASRLSSWSQEGGAATRCLAPSPANLRAISRERRRDIQRGWTEIQGRRIETQTLAGGVGQGPRQKGKQEEGGVEL